VVQGHAGHVLDELAEGGEPVVGVGEPGARLGVDAEAAAVVLGQERHRPSQRHGLAQVPHPEQAGEVQDLPDPGGVGQQLALGRGPEAGLGRDQLVGTQVVVGRGVQVDQPLLPQLQHRDRGEGLGDRGDPKHRVLGDGRARGDVGQPVAGEEFQASVADHALGQADGGPAIRDPADPGLQLERVDPGDRHGHASSPSSEPG
jgi:hypothetical protein